MVTFFDFQNTYPLKSAPEKISHTVSRMTLMLSSQEKAQRYIRIEHT